MPEDTYDADLFYHPQETWDAKKCERLSKSNPKNAFGDRKPFKGYIGSSASIPSAFGATYYNGGCIRKDGWYRGEFFPFPKLAEGYEIEYVLTWGWRIKKTTDKPTSIDFHGNKI